MSYEASGDGVAVSTANNNNNNEDYIALESSPFQSLGGENAHEDSKSLVCTLDPLLIFSSIL